MTLTLGTAPGRLDRAPAALVFDWDNTLVDNWQGIHAALNATLEAMGQAAWTYAETRARVRGSARDAFPRLFGERWEAAADLFARTFAAGHLAGLATMPGADRLIGGIDVPIAVVSNKHGTFVRAEASHLGWTGRFAGLVGAGDAVRDKPDRAPVDAALAAAGVAAGPDVWFVGDTAIDMACAHAAGCTAVLVGRDMMDDDYASHPPHAHLDDLDALRHRLTGLGVATGAASP